MKLARRLCIALPALPDLVLALSTWIAERFRIFPRIRRAGIKCLSIRRRLAFLRGAVAESGSWKSLKRSFARQLAVLLFHNIDQLDATTTYPGMTIPPKQFKKQIAWLARNGYTGIRSSDWVSWCQLGTPLPPKPVLLTFDDAYAGVARYALPVLHRFGFGAAVYIVTRQIGGTNAWEKEAGGVGTDQLMTETEIVEWDGKGIEFGAHSLNHRDLTKLNQQELTEEVVGSAQELSHALGAKVTSFAYPYGYYNDVVHDAGVSVFDLAVTCEEGLNDLGTDLCRMRRTMVHQNDSWVDLACRVRFPVEIEARVQHGADPGQFLERSYCFVIVDVPLPPNGLRPERQIFWVDRSGKITLGFYRAIECDAHVWGEHAIRILNV